MDDIVKQALAKWPHVPDCFNWLALDARGQWLLRDDRVQALGTFQSGAPGSKGSVLLHEKLRAFIGRNYLCDAQGRWFFQNGPQRVFVELEITPWVWRLQWDQMHSVVHINSHTGVPATLRHPQCLTDEQGWIYLETHLGLGLVHSQDVVVAAQAIERGNWGLQTVARRDLAQQGGYVLSPHALA